MNRLFLNSILLSVTACILIACGSSNNSNTKPSPSQPIINETTDLTIPAGHTACTTPRPEICTQQYVPACGYWTGGPNCKPGAPCQTVLMLKSKTFSNSCTACSNPLVQHVKEGACPTP